MKEQAELTWQALPGGHWHAIATKGIHLCSLMMVILLLALTNPSKAESLPKAEDGYLYYCTGGRADSFLERPNAFILFKLQKDEVRDDKKAGLLCATDYVDEQFVVKRFFEKGDVMLDGEVNFTIPLQVDGKEYKFEVTTWSNSYMSGSRGSHFDTKRRVCGFEEQLDKNGLLPAKRPPKISCRMTSYKAFGSFEDSTAKLEVSCFGKEKCLLSFFHQEWEFSIRAVPYALLPHWREIHEKVVSAIDERVVFYIAPNRCKGPLACKDLARILKIEMN